MKRSFVLLFLLAATLFVKSGTAEGETLSIEHLFTVQEAARGEYLGKPASIAVDTLRGEVFVSDRMRKEILIYDEDGQFLQRIGRRSGIQVPLHLAVGSSGTLVIGEQDLPRLAFLEMNGIQSVGIDLKLDNSVEILSGGISITPDGEIFLVERFGKRIVRINQETGSIQRFFSGTRATSGEVEFQDIITTPDKTIIAVSSRGYAIHVLDDKGGTLKRFGEHGSKAENFSFPIAATLGPNGNIWIIDTFQHSIKVFRQDGSFYGEFGEMGTDEGKFFFPIDIAFGRGNRLFVLEKGVPRFQAFQLLNPDESGSR